MAERFSLYEHQSVYSPDLPLRVLFYIRTSFWEAQGGEPVQDVDVEAYGAGVPDFL